MNQKQFADYIIPKLLEHFPQFVASCVAKPNDIIDIEYKSPSKQLELWITTQNIEITIGFTGNESLNDWHTHITTYDPESLDEDIQKAVELIRTIIYDKSLIFYSNLKGYMPWYPGESLTPESFDEIILIKYWSQF